MAALAKSAKKNILITVPKISLIDQTVEKLKLTVDDVGVYCGSMGKKDLDNQFIVSTIQSARNVMADFHLVIVDEAHLMDNSINKLLKNINHSYVIGMTGTPFLTENIYGDEKYWSKPCVSLSLKELTDQGFLTPIVMASTEHKIDLTGIKTSGGDYVQSQLVERYKPIIRQQVIDALERTMDRVSVLWVCVNIEHAEMIYSMVDNSILTHSKTKVDIDRFRRGEVKHLISVAQVHTGFDAPIADTLVLMRPTKSKSLFVQACGRIVRLYKNKKDALLLDYGKVVENLGHPYSITSADCETSECKICSECQTYCSPTAKSCYECDSDFLVNCETCFETKPHGEPCGTCEKKRVERDVFKDLTTSPKSDWEPVTHIRVSDYKSKNGNRCIKADYYNGFNYLVSEYLNDKVPKKRDDFFKWHCDAQYFDVEDFFDSKPEITPPKSIRIVIENGYKKIQSRNI